MDEGQPPQAAPASVPVEVWKGCYDASWDGLITEESFAHPAKMARGLVRRIFDEFMRNGWLRPGEVVIDPFGGIGTTSIEGASRGLRCYSVELEPRFNRLAKGHDCPGFNADDWEELCPSCARKIKREELDNPETNVHLPPYNLPAPHHFVGNFELHRRTWELAGDPLPVMVEGDSRELGRLLGPLLAAGCVSSPPFMESDNNSRRPRETEEYAEKFKSFVKGRIGQNHGDTLGNLASLKEGRRP